jgi:hypothetical protein
VFEELMEKSWVRVRFRGYRYSQIAEQLLFWFDFLVKMP